MRALVAILALLTSCSSLVAKDTVQENKSQDIPPLVVIYGPPGSGRGHTTIRISHTLQLPRISFATLLQEYSHDDTSLGERVRDYLNRGGDTPTDLFMDVLYERISQPDCEHGALLEGFPYTVDQAKAMQDSLSSKFNFMVFTLHASDDWMIQRVEQRIICHTCGRVYNESKAPPKKQGFCDICSSPLQRRIEDSPDVMRDKIDSYNEEISPVLQYYKAGGLLVEVPGERSLDAIAQDILQEINTKSNNGVATR